MRRLAAVTAVAVVLGGCGGSALPARFGPGPARGPTALFAIACPAPAECVATGAAGEVEVTRDAGEHWHTVTTGVTGRLLAVTCTSQLHCIAVGDGGAAVITDDGGARWRRARSGTTEELDGISCPNPRQCVAVGYLGTVIGSVNAGVTWKTASSLDGELTSISCRITICAAVTLRTALDSPAMEYVSGDLGVSWVGQPLDTDRNFFGVDCITAHVCRAVGDEGSVDSTTDGGASWNDFTLPEYGALHTVACPRVTYCLAAGDMGVIFRRSGSGWTQVAPIGAVASRQVVEGIACPTLQRCWAVGDQGTVVATRDGGRTWRTQLTSPASADTRILLVGDSVAQTLGSEIPAMAHGYGLYVDDYGILGCGIASGEPVRAAGVTYDVIAPPCDGKPGDPQWPVYWHQYVEQLRPRVGVLLAGFWEVTDRMFQGQWANITEPAYRSYIETQLQVAVRTLSAEGAKVVLLTSPYFQTGNYPEDDPSRVDAYNSLVRQVAAQFPGVASVIDLNGFADPGGHFTATLDGVPLRQSDGEHFTNAGSTLVASWLLPQLASLAG